MARLSIRQTPSTRAQVSAKTLSLVQTLSFSVDEQIEALTEASINNPALQVKFSLETPRARHWSPFRLADSALDALAIAAPEGSLYSHVSAQMGLLVRDHAQLDLAHAWLSRLEPTGWVAATPDEIAAETGKSRKAATEVLRLLQQAEPAGLFARSLSECLRLQLQARDQLSYEMELLLDNLPMLADGDWEALSDRCGVSPAAIPQMVGHLRRLDPKPGATFNFAPVLPAAPGFELLIGPDGRWVLERSGYLAPTVSPAEFPKGPELAAAAQIVRATESRDKAVYAVARQVVVHHDAFLTGVARFPHPLTIRQIASAVNLHETTVGRIRNQVVLGFAGSRMHLRTLFVPGIPAGRAGKISAAELRDRIRRALVLHGDLSDTALCELLARDGLDFARRTVAKYRAQAVDRQL
ncbi:RNA polymerase factor sigma-54 [Pseudosulfitobacter sp. RP-4]